MTAAHFALNDGAGGGFSVEGFTNLNIDSIGGGSGAGTIRMANSNDAATAYAFLPNSSPRGGDAWFGPSGAAPTAGNYDWATILHELGHSLGLSHGHQEDTTPGGAGVEADFDSLEYTVMTYHTFIGDDLNGYKF